MTSTHLFSCKVYLVCSSTNWNVISLLLHCTVDLMTLTGNPYYPWHVLPCIIFLLYVAIHKQGRVIQLQENWDCNNEFLLHCHYGTNICKELQYIGRRLQGEKTNPDLQLVAANLHASSAQLNFNSSLWSLVSHHLLLPWRRTSSHWKWMTASHFCSSWSFWCEHTVRMG